MEKICIVNLRKQIAGSDNLDEGCRLARYEKEYARLTPHTSIYTGKNNTSNGDAGNGDTGGNYEGESRTVTLTLTREQSRTLRAAPYLISCFGGEVAGGIEETAYRGNTLVIKFEFEPQALVRLLKPEEVVQMLRISKSYLYEVVRKGKLKSYKMGRLRRFMFDDVLSYLEDNLDRRDLLREAAISAKSRRGLS